jgi:hypothetical protein
MLAAWPQKELTIYVGCYRNDAATIAAASTAAGQDQRVRVDKPVLRSAKAELRHGAGLGAGHKRGQVGSMWDPAPASNGRSGGSAPGSAPTIAFAWLAMLPRLQVRR